MWRLNAIEIEIGIETAIGIDFDTDFDLDFDWNEWLLKSGSSLKVDCQLSSRIHPAGPDTVPQPCNP